MLWSLRSRVRVIPHRRYDLCAREKLFLGVPLSAQNLSGTHYMRRILRRMANAFGYDIVALAADRGLSHLDDVSPEVRTVIERVRPFTMTSPERVAALCAAAEYIVKAGIPGDFVECGVWRGGSAMAAALTFARLGRDDIPLHLFDTFEGMTKPTEHDFNARTGERAIERFQELANGNKKWACASIEDVGVNLETTGYPKNCIRLVKGKVEETIPASAPKSISLLRLDTDWYESTRRIGAFILPAVTGRGPNR